MQQLKERILREGRVLPGNIIKVDGFLNHRVDTALMRDLADEFAKYFDVKNITMVLTAEASGIALATICAERYGVPMVFAKKAKSDNIEGGLYQSDIFSYTYKKKVTLLVSQDWITKDDKVLIIDDFMAKGYAMRGLIDIVNKAGAQLAGVTEPEHKRKIIGEEFIRVFEEEAKKIGAVDFLAQGTIYPDVVESGLGGESVVIKSHHNVGGLPDCVDFKEIVEPLRRLFKDEVRKLGTELGLPDELVWRQPFPGPGLAIRVIGDITEEKLTILREADAIFREEMKLAGLDRTTSQFFAVLTDLRSVGVMGDERTYDYTLALRAVQSQDFMTATWSRLPYELLDKVSGRIVGEVKHINRICYDITSKPPATVEWE